jgi:hypothetical protein
LAAGFDTVFLKTTLELILKAELSFQTSLLPPWEKRWLIYEPELSQSYRIRAFFVRESITVVGSLTVVFPESASMFLVLSKCTTVVDAYTLIDAFSVTSEYAAYIVNFIGICFAEREYEENSGDNFNQIRKLRFRHERLRKALWADIVDNSFHRGIEDALLFSGQYEIWRYLMIETEQVNLGTD